MSICVNIGFLSAHLNHRECELFLESGKIIAYVPAKQEGATRIETGDESFIVATMRVMQWGLVPQWN